jgi:3-dehydroquinate dehydratase-2
MPRAWCACGIPSAAMKFVTEPDYKVPVSGAGRAPGPFRHNWPRRAINRLSPTRPPATMPKILLIQGPNLSYLGRRQPEIYGRTSAAELDAMLLEHARTNKYALDIFYTHSESAAIERLYRAVDEKIDGLVMNPAAFIFAGYALRDTLRAVPFPYVEIHITNIEKRGIHSILAETGVGIIAGFGVRSYILGLDAMLGHLRAQRRPRSKAPRRRDARVSRRR